MNQSPNQPNFTSPPYPQPRSTPAYSRLQPTQLADLPPLPQPGSLPKDYHFPPPSRSDPLTSGPAIHDIPTTKLTAMPAKPPKRKRRKGWMIASVLVLLLLIGGGAGAFVVLRPSNTHTSKLASRVTATPTSTQPTNGALGQPLQAGPNWLATVTNIHTTTISDFPPQPGHTYLEISLTLKNVSPNTQFVSSLLEFTLADSTGKQYTESVNDTYTHQAVDGHLTLNQTLTGQIVYEVPQAQHQFMLVFHYGLPDGSGATVSWQIALK